MTDSIPKKLEPIGYLNKMTGHIWTPIEQPDAAEHTGIYEPLVRLSDVHGLVAENARMARPVVLPKLCSAIEGEYADNCQIVPDTDGYIYWSNEVIAAIKEAGYPVQGE